MRIREGFSWSFNGIEKSHEFRRKDFHGVAVHGSFRRPLNSCPMKKHGYAINIERLIDHEKFSWPFDGFLRANEN